MAAIGCGFNGDNWIAPINWTKPSTIPAIEGGTWGLVKSMELIETDVEPPHKQNDGGAEVSGDPIIATQEYP